MTRAKTIEEYVEVIDRLQKDKGSARTSEIASDMGIRPASVTQMLKKLHGEGLVKYQPYHGGRLTRKGQRLAGELTRKHRTLADFLELIGVEEEYAEQDACRIEHIVTKNTLTQLGRFISFVKDSPDGVEWLDEFQGRSSKRRDRG